MIFIPFVVLFLTEITKLVVQSIKYKKFDLAWFAHSGGMPSGHSSFTTSIATLVAYLEGYNSVAFLIALGLAVVVMYDARGVRAVVGQHAKLLNLLHSGKDKKGQERLLEEYVGHTNWEVIAGAAVGIIYTVLIIRFAIPVFEPSLLKIGTFFM